MSADASSAAVATLPVRLTTRSPKYSIPSDAFILPAQWRRFQLSALVNKILDPQGTAPAAIPFDFVVEGELLRGSLQAWVDERRGGKTEEVLELEFIESVLPPQHLSSYEHDDWISDVSVQRQGLFLTSAYDSRLRIFTSSASASGAPSSSAAPIVTVSAGAISGGLTSCSWLTPPPRATGDAEVDWLAAGGMDGITRLWSVPHVDASTVIAAGERGPQATALMELHHHASPVSSLQASNDGQYVLTAGWDSTLAVFPIHHAPESHDPAVPVPRQLSNRQTKRRKVDPSLADDPDDEDVAKGGWRVGPEAVLRGHQARVGKAVWDKSDSGRVWSCAWDGSVRGWDVDLQVNAVVKQAPTDKVCLSMDQLAPLSASSTLLLTSHADRTVSLWDAREATSIISLSFPSAHASHIPVVRAHPTNANAFFTAGHDGAIKVWDVRSPKQALLGVSRTMKPGKEGKEKLLGGDWDGRIVAVGGESCELEVYQGNM